MQKRMLNLSRNQFDLGTVLGILGSFIFFLGFALLIPFFISILYEETIWHTFLYSAGIAFVIGGALYYLFPPEHELQVREGFLVVSLTWLFLSLVGALPFVISGFLPSYTDAVFETMSGLTTTGATVFNGTTAAGVANPAIESLPNSLLFWRSLSHWLGGMGIIVLSLAILPLLGVGGMQLFQAESPGPTADKLTPRVQETAKLLWGVYVAFTALEFLLLWVHPSMDWFEAVNHAFATMATGGFSTKNNSIAAFDSVYIDVIITIFMFIAGINFAMHFRLLKGDVKTFFNNREMRFYALITAVSIAVVSFSLWIFNSYSFGGALRSGAFQVVSIITTTGFVTDNYQLWYSLGAFVLFLLFFTGGCAGSTGGGIKMIRLLVVIRNTFRELKQIIHPKAILPVQIGDHTVERDVQRSVLSFFVLYLFVFGIGSLIMSTMGYDIQSSIGATIACLGNVGPGWGALGPTASFAKVPIFGKWMLILFMMIGRLEIFTVILLFTPSFWKQ